MKNRLVAALIGVIALGFAGLAHADYIGNKDSKIFHSDQCPMVKAMKAENKVVFKTADEAIKAGYKQCKKCAVAEKAAAKPAFVGNKGSMIYHMAACPMVATMKADNMVNFATKEEAEKAGYKPCSKCFPSDKKDAEKAKKDEVKAAINNMKTASK